MNTNTDNDERERQIITNESVKDAEGNVIAENVTCETSTRLRVLDVARYEQDAA